MDDLDFTDADHALEALYKERDRIDAKIKLIKEAKQIATKVLSEETNDPIHE